MKLINTILPLAALTSAFVIPDEQITEQLILESKKQNPHSLLDSFQDNVDQAWSYAEDTFKDAVTFSGNVLDNALNSASDVAQKAKSTFECHASLTKWDIQGWLDSAVTTVEEEVDVFDHPHRKPKHPHHPHHGHPHHKPNKTVYELISGSKYTTKFAKLIDKFPDLVDALNGTAANYTVFAPTDKAFEKIPHHGKKPDDELIKAILAYHFSPEFFPAQRILFTHTIPTAFGEPALGGAQRLRVSFGLRGLVVNFYSKVVAANIFGTNGVIHGVDSILLPPPPAYKIIELFPGEFSTLQLGLEKTGVFDALSEAPHIGGTFFAPTNWAFKKLGPKINAFLFSSYGQKYLKALLQYHIVANQTLYSDAFYKATDADEAVKVVDEVDLEGIPKGHYHVDLPTLLEDKSLSIDIARFGGFITIKINGFSGVQVQDGLAKDGVIHILSSILIPPKTPGGAQYMGEEMSVEEFKERFDPFVPEL